MSNKSRLQTNNESLQLLIDKANELPDTGSGGGVETCTVELSTSEGFFNHVLYTQFENGEIKAYLHSVGNGNVEGSSSLSLTNVICGSALYLGITSDNTYIIENYSKAELLYGTSDWKITAKSGEVAVISFMAL